MASVDYRTPGDSMGGDDHSFDDHHDHSGVGAAHHNSPTSQTNDNDTTCDDPASASNNNDTQNTNSQSQLAEDDEEEESQLLFSCQCDSARTIATLLSCLRRVVTAGGGPNSWTSSSSSSGGATQGAYATQTTSQRGGGYYNTQQSTTISAVQGGSANKIQHATVYAGPNGLTFHVQHGLAKQSQCSVDMPRGLFREYFVGEEEVWLEDSDAEHDHDHDDNNTTSQTTSQGGGIGQKEIIQGGEFGVNLTTVLECFSILSKNRDTMTKTNISSGSTGSGSAASHQNHHGGEYSSLNNVPLCMSYDRGTATFHLEFLEGGISGGGAGGGENGLTTNMGGGCLVTCEVPGVAVADDVDDGPDEDVLSHNNNNNTTTHSSSSNANSGLANAFRSSPLLSRAILYSDALQSAVSELYDVPGASVVQVALSNKGIELGTVGPRSEVWVNVPYHRGQSGMYVGLECYKEPSSVPIFGSLATSSSSLTKDGQIVRRYSLSAFLSGMRGLDIGVETCVSVNARGMMAIQHQVSRDGYYDFSEDGGNGGTMRPSFVDFIMVCIEDEEVDGGDDNAMSQVSQGNSVEFQDHNNNGLYDITNSGSTDDIDAGRGSRKAAKSRGRGRAKKAAPARDESSSSEDEEEMPTRKTSKRDKQEGDDFGGNDDNVDFCDEHEYKDNNDAERSSSRNANNAASRILGELEMDQDLLTSRRGVAAPGTQNKKNALEDIRRRRREQMLSRQSQLQKSDGEDGPSGEDDDNNESNESRKGGRKRNSDGSSKATSRSGSRRNDESEEEDDDSHGLGRKNRSQPQDTQSQSQSEEDEDSGDETEHEDSLDVNAEVPLLFSKRSSLSTSRHGSRRSSSRGPISSMDHSDNEEEEQEPRMMYGDTKLEFTQDDYDSE